MKTLPSPRGGRVTHIIHIADTHLRKGDEVASRMAETTAVFATFLHMVGQLQCVQDGTVIAVLAGDVTHSKGLIEPPAMEMFDMLVDGLAQLMPTLVTAGNHDFNMEKDPRTYDIVGALMRGKAGNAVYLRDTGHYRCANVGIGTVVMQDRLQPGASSGYAATPPEFPAASALDGVTGVDFKMALFHGMIAATRLPGGSTVVEDASIEKGDRESAREIDAEAGDRDRGVTGVPLRWFGPGYHALLLGDVHLAQFHNMKRLDEVTLDFTSSLCPPSTFASDTAQSPLPFAYPGSLLQQDFGEPLFGHGFILWDLARREARHVHVPNRLGRVQLRHDVLAAGEGWTVSLSTGAGKRGGPWVALPEAMRQPWFPRDLEVRVAGLRSSPDDVRAAEAHVMDVGLRVVQIQEYVAHAVARNMHGVVARPAGVDEDETTQDDPGDDLTVCDTAEEWVRCMSQTLSQTSEWQAWLMDATRLQVPMSSGMSGMSPPAGFINVHKDKVDEYNADICKLALGPSGADDQTRRHDTIPPLKIVSVWWSYVGTYGPDNWFDFGAAKGRIALLSGPNGAGKSTLTEVLCYAIHNDPLPSRENPTHSAAIVSYHAPKVPRSQGARTSTARRAHMAVILDVKGVMFRITRTLVADDDPSALALDTSPSTLQRLNADGTDDKSFKKMRLVGDIKVWVRANVGDLRSFLTSTLLSQADDSNFLTGSDAQQIALVNAAIGFHATEAMGRALRKAVSSHESVATMIEGAIRTTRCNMAERRGRAAVDVPQTSLCSIKELDDVLETRRTQAQIVAELSDRAARLRDVWTSCAGGSRATFASMQCDGEPIDMMCGDEEGLQDMRRRVAELEGRASGHRSTHSVHCELGLAEMLREIAAAEEELGDEPPMCEEETMRTRCRHAAWIGRWPGEWTADATLSWDTPASALIWQGIRHASEQAADAMTAANTALVAAEGADRAADLLVSVAASVLVRCEPARPVTFHDLAEVAAGTSRLALLQQGRLGDPDVDSAEMARMERYAEGAYDAAAAATAAFDRVTDAVPSPTPHMPSRATAVEGERAWRHELEECIPARRIALLKGNTCQTVADVEAYSRTSAASLDACLSDITSSSMELSRAGAALAAAKSLAYPYDPECNACVRQPWKLHEDDLMRIKVAASAHVNHSCTRGSLMLTELICDGSKNGCPGECPGECPGGCPGEFQVNESVIIGRLRRLSEDHTARAQAAVTWMADLADLEGRRTYWDGELAAHTYRHEWLCRLAAARELSSVMTSAASAARVQCAAARSCLRRASEIAALEALLISDAALGAAWTAWGLDLQRAHGAELVREGTRRDVTCTRALAVAAVSANAAAKELDAAMGRFVIDLPAARNDALALQRHTTQLCTRRRLSDLRDARDDAMLALARRALSATVERVAHRRLRDVGLPAYIEWEQLDARLAEAVADVSRLDVVVGGLLNARRDSDADVLKVAELERFGVAMRGRLTLMKEVERAFAAYRAGVYSTHVIRVIGREVNRTLAMMQDGLVRQIRLVIKWRVAAPTLKSKATCGVFDWYVRVGSDPTPVPYHGASGFQKAAVGIAMRIALARIGGAGVASRALIIDEGFRDCDADNLARVPPFLNGLLRTAGYDNIVIISHIKDIKDCATIRVPIVQSPAAAGNQLSTVRFGVRPRSDM